MDANWIMREVGIEAALDIAIDELFGEDFLFRIEALKDKIVSIEARDYLGLKEPIPGDIASEIAYFREYRRLERFRKEELIRGLLDITWLRARLKARGDPNKHDLIYAAQMLKGQVLDLGEFEIRKDLDERYYGLQ